MFSFWIIQVSQKLFTFLNSEPICIRYNNFNLALWLYQLGHTSMLVNADKHNSKVTPKLSCLAYSPKAKTTKWADNSVFSYWELIQDIITNYQNIISWETWEKMFE